MYLHFRIDIKTRLLRSRIILFCRFVIAYAKQWNRVILIIPIIINIDSS